MSRERGQVHTIEGFFAGMLIILATLYAVEAVGITSTSASTASPEIESELSRTADSILTQANSNGNLKETVLRWNSSDGEFYGAGEEFYYKGVAPPGDFGETLEWTLASQGIAYNIDLAYESTDGEITTVPLVDNGQPSDNAVVARELVVLYSTDRLWDGRRIDRSNHPVADLSGSGLYNVVEVRLVVWRI